MMSKDAIIITTNSTGRTLSKYRTTATLPLLAQRSPLFADEKLLTAPYLIITILGFYEEQVLKIVWQYLHTGKLEIPTNTLNHVICTTHTLMERFAVGEQGTVDWLKMLLVTPLNSAKRDMIMNDTHVLLEEPLTIPTYNLVITLRRQLSDECGIVPPHLINYNLYHGIKRWLKGDRNLTNHLFTFLFSTKAVMHVENKWEEANIYLFKKGDSIMHSALSCLTWLGERSDVVSFNYYDKRSEGDTWRLVNNYNRADYFSRTISDSSIYFSTIGYDISITYHYGLYLHTFTLNGEWYVLSLSPILSRGVIEGEAYSRIDEEWNSIIVSNCVCSDLIYQYGEKEEYVVEIEEDLPSLMERREKELMAIIPSGYRVICAADCIKTQYHLRQKDKTKLVIRRGVM